MRTVQGQMYSILTKYTVVSQMLRFVGGDISLFIGGFTAATNNLANSNIRRRPGRDRGGLNILLCMPRHQTM